MEYHLNVCNSPGNRNYIKAFGRGLADFCKLEAMLRPSVGVGGPTPLNFAEDFVTDAFPRDLRRSAKIGGNRGVIRSVLATVSNRQTVREPSRHEANGPADNAY